MLSTTNSFDIAMPKKTFDQFLIIMSALAALVFFALFFIKAGYGKFASDKWGLKIPNKVAWIIMEAPVFFVMLMFWLSSYSNGRMFSFPHIVFFALFQTHYFQRSFIFPLLVKGKGQMPISVMLMGAIFNVCNGIMQGEWIFFVSPDDYYSNWISDYRFYIGLLVFAIGMFINIHSDHVIRNLRKPGDNRHYLPSGGLYRYVTSANYFGEIVEWIGFAICTWSPSALVFVWWSIANLVPRAFAIYNRYVIEFGTVVLTKRRIVPFIL